MCVSKLRVPAWTSLKHTYPPRLGVIETPGMKSFQRCIHAKPGSYWEKKGASATVAPSELCEVGYQWCDQLHPHENSEVLRGERSCPNTHSDTEKCKSWLQIFVSSLWKRWIFLSSALPSPSLLRMPLASHPSSTEDHGLSFLASRHKLLFHFWTPKFPNANVITQWILYAVY